MNEAQRLRDEVWANNHPHPDGLSAEEAVRQMREEDQRIEDLSWASIEDSSEADDRTPEQFTADLFRALGWS